MKYASFAIVLLGTIVVARAVPPSDDSITQMLSVMKVEQSVNQILVQMDNGIKTGIEQGFQQSAQGKQVTPEQKASLEAFRQKLSAMMREELSFAKMKDIYLQVYRETFNQEEVNGILAFYSSPAGKAMVEKYPLTQEKVGTLMQARVGPMTQKMQTMEEDFLKGQAQTK